MGSVAASQLQGLWLYPTFELQSVWSFMCSPCDCVSFFGLSPAFKKNYASGLLGYSKFFLGVYKCVPR